MKNIGLIGGTTWISTMEYYQIINKKINEKLGGSHSVKCIIYSVDFEEAILKNQGKWNVIAQIFIDIAKKLEQVGADFLIICANTLHKIASDIQKNIEIPILHIVDVTGEKIQKNNLKKIGLLGTKYTMEERFYKQRLKDKFNIETIIPEKNDRKLIHDIIINELSRNIILKSSKKKYIEVINNLLFQGAEGIILGCTEIPLLINKNDVNTQIFDTTTIHAKAAVDFALK
jgi:aspartate racemase